MSTFIAVIEQEPKIAFEIKWNGESVPHDIKFPDGSLITLVGKYASPGERFCYRRVEPIQVSYTEFTVVSYNKLAGVTD